MRHESGAPELYGGVRISLKVHEIEAGRRRKTHAPMLPKGHASVCVGDLGACFGLCAPPRFGVAT